MNSTASAKEPHRPFTTKELVLTAMFTALIAVCSIISIPIGEISLTLQTFAVFCALNIIGGRNGLFSVLVYILLGCIGLPVFSKMQSGAGVITGPTGGYILGFVLMALVYWGGTKLLGKSLPVRVSLMVVGLILCYTFGTIWFVFGYTKSGSDMTFIHAMELCVLPYIPGDVVKLILALVITERIKKHADI